MSGRTNLKTYVLVAAFSLAIVSTTFAGRVIYVDADAIGANDGSSWADAYNYLQDALNAAWSGDEIRVTQGVYKPNQGMVAVPEFNWRTTTFQLKNGVTLKGSYAGLGEPDPDARDFELYETILSGDLNGDDAAVTNAKELLYEVTRSENSYHVVTGSGTDETAILDGFTITAGNANGSSYQTAEGGGVYNGDGSPMLTNCTFIVNSAEGSGGGMSNSYYSNPIVVRCIFTRNCAQHMGGGMAGSNNQSVRSCKFIENFAKTGGGIYGEVSLKSCIFTKNSASEKGGALKGGGILDGCAFVGNWAGISGGGMNGGGTLTNCVFVANEAGERGGAMDAGGTMTNCTFSGNWAGQYGGTIYCDTEGFTLLLINCTITGNRAAHMTGGIYTRWETALTLNNCILWYNSDALGMAQSAQIYYTDGAAASDYSCIQGWTGSLGGTSNIGDDPRFVSPGYWDAGGLWIEGDYHLSPTSPCIDAGDPDYVTGPNETDLDGKPRIVGGRIDMGPYELPLQADARIVPHTLNLSSKGKWITCYIWLPEDYNVHDIDPNSVLLEDEIGAESIEVYEGRQIALVRFSREQVQAILNIGEVELAITGQLTDGSIFEAKNVIIVINKGSRNSAK
ncbi:MAG TPA: hypothetical protein HPP66_09835 [Planctomycetes bacterium]|nr:hypothetical protein [Planctomycetota bacterium]